MSTEQVDPTKKNIAQKPPLQNQNPPSGKPNVTPTEDQGQRAFDKAQPSAPKDIDALRHPEEQIIDLKN